MRLAHIVNPVAVGETSDLFTAQPITFQTMVEAKRYAAPRVPVELFTAQFAEDRGLAPAEFVATPDLDRSIRDCGDFKQSKKLPLIKDILDRLYEATAAEHLIYTNVDIGVQPYFYVAIAELIGQGYDAFTINRRVVSGQFKRSQDIPRIWAEAGKRHGGHDCFVFARSLYPKFRLGKVCIGTGGVGRALIYNLLCHGTQVTLFSDKHLTFHIGEDQPWRDGKFREMLEFNKQECERMLQQLESEFGHFDYTRIGDVQLKQTGAKRLIRRLVSGGRSLRGQK